MQHSTDRQTLRLWGTQVAPEYMVYRVHTYVGVHACGVACMHQLCRVQIELLQRREDAEALRQLNLNVQARLSMQL